jgi:hypothetical protein
MLCVNCEHSFSVIRLTGISKINYSQIPRSLVIVMLAMYCIHNETLMFFIDILKCHFSLYVSHTQHYDSINMNYVSLYNKN